MPSFYQSAPVADSGCRIAARGAGVDRAGAACQRVPMLPPDDGGSDAAQPPLVHVDALRPTDAASTCLRPLGLCEIGSCDVCWYNPEARARLAQGRGPEHFPGTPGDDPAGSARR
jgi:hypothetical protein